MLFPILLLSAAGFTVLTTEFVIVGLLPSIARDLNVSVSQAGLLVTLFAFTVAAFGPFLTAYCARFPRKRLFISILIMFAAANTVAALAPNIWVMALARLIPALGLPVFWALASETAVDIVGPEFAGRAIEKIGFGIVCATVFGIPVGTLISDMFGWRTAFAVLAVIALAKALLLYVYLPVTPAKHQQASLRSQFKILRSPVMQGHILLSILVFSGMFTAYTYLADILERLADDTDSSVRFNVGNNPNSPKNVLEKLSHDQVTVVRCIVSENPKTPKSTLHYLSRDPDSFVRMCLASNTHTPKEVLTELSRDGADIVGVQVGENRNTPRNVLISMAKDNSFAVRLSVAGNPNTPKKILFELLQTEGDNELMRRIILENATFRK